MNIQAFALAFAGKLDPAEEIRKSFETPEIQELQKCLQKQSGRTNANESANGARGMA